MIERVQAAPNRSGGSARPNGIGADPAVSVDPDGLVVPEDAVGEDALTRHLQLALLAQRKRQDAGEMAIDHMRAEFDMHEQQRAEFLREWNVIRDMAMEQMKRDDDIVKKWIALI